MSPCRLDDADRVPSERRREHLAGRVRDEVGTSQPRDALVDRMRGEQPPPAQREHRDGRGHDHDRQREPGEVRIGEDVERRAEVDLPDEVRDRGGRQDERPDLTRPTRHASVRPRASRGDGTKVVGWGRVRRPTPADARSRRPRRSARAHAACARCLRGISRARRKPAPTTAAPTQSAGTRPSLKVWLVA